MSNIVQAEGNFFKAVFGCQEAFACDWYISLISEGFELAVIDAQHETIPAPFRKVCQGIAVSIEVDHVDEVHAAIT